MANCPECKVPLRWTKLFPLHHRSVIACANCDTRLVLNRERSSAIGGTFLVLMLLPFMPQLGIENPLFWIMPLIPLYLLAWVNFIKFDKIATKAVRLTDGELSTLKAYAARRRKFNRIALMTTSGGIGIWLFDAFVLGSILGEYATILLLLVIFGAVFGLYFTRCPYCHKITPALHMTSCWSCHQNIDIRNGHL